MEARRILETGGRPHRRRRLVPLASGALILAAACEATDKRGEGAPRSEPQSLRPRPAAEERPALDENMGRGFQGRLQMRLSTPTGEQTLRYLTRGNRARLQLDSTNASPEQGSKGSKLREGSNFDALIWDENISLMDHVHDTYRTVSLDEIEAGNEPGESVSVRETGERDRVAGVFCERYEIIQGATKILACVSAVPGTFDVNKLEKVSGLDAPAWVEQLLEDDLFPLQARAVGPSGLELYSLELIEYSADPVDESVLRVPSTYAARTGAPTNR